MVENLAKLQLAILGFKMRSDQMAVSVDGIFYSFQGEGVTMGCPAVFLRLQGCNLNCVWCDTRYTWDSSVEGFSGRSVLSIDEAVQQIKDLGGENGDCRRLIITGGEPLL